MTSGNFDDRYYDSDDGLRLHYRYYGGEAPGLPVVCLPGITRNCRDFEDLAPHLAARNRVLAPDLRGRGFSERDPEWKNYQPLTYVTDTLRLLEAEGIARAAFLGTSLGGLVSMILAARHRKRVAGVILNDVGPEIAEEGLARISGYIGWLPPVADWDEAERQVREIYGPALPGLPETMWPRLARRGFREDDDGVPVLDMDLKIGDAAREVGTGLVDPWEMFAAMGELPAMVLHGALSDVLTDDIVGRMQAVKPDLEHVRIEDRGHVPLLDETVSLAAIDRFLGALS